MKTLRFIDLFSWMGGMRLGFEQAAESLGFKTKCVLTSETNESAIEIHERNHPGEEVLGDLSEIKSEDIPDFDYLLAGLSGTIVSIESGLFEIERILRDKSPIGFLLEGTESLASHGTIDAISSRFRGFGYDVEWRVVDSATLGVPQRRRRVYVAGSKHGRPSFDGMQEKTSGISDILESGLPVSKTQFTKQLLKFFSVNDLCGKKIKDTRGGKDNIHSWQFELRGETTSRQKEILEKILTERRKRGYAKEYGVEWYDGVPMSLEMLERLFDDENLEDVLEDLVEKGYLKKSRPKRRIDGRMQEDESLPEGYNITSGKMSFDVSEILDPEELVPTLDAMGMHGLHVVDGPGIRPLSTRELLRLFGYPEDFKFDVVGKAGRKLIGNTVVVPAIKAVAERLLNSLHGVE